MQASCTTGFHPIHGTSLDRENASRRVEESFTCSTHRVSESELIARIPGNRLMCQIERHPKIGRLTGYVQKDSMKMNIAVITTMLAALPILLANAWRKRHKRAPRSQLPGTQEKHDCFGSTVSRI